MTDAIPDPIERILFPTDFSATSMAALGHAERLAASTGAELLILHVFPVPDVWGSGGNANEVNDATKKQLAEIQPQMAGVRCQHVAHGGPPGEVICWIAQERHCDLIVLGTHGRTGLAHLLMGSVAEHVVQHAPCPVLTVRQQRESEKPLKEPIISVPMPPVF